MEFQITSEWVAAVQRDSDVWHERLTDWSRAGGADGRIIGWPDMSSPLKYTAEAEEVVITGPRYVWR